MVRSNAEAEYKTMTLVICEIIWLKQLLKEPKFESFQMHVVCDN